MDRIKTGIDGVELLMPKIYSDKRGSFSEIINDSLPFLPVQTNWVENIERYTFRGMHWQAEPFAQAKIVKCASGSILDVILDIRKDSPTFGKYLVFEINDWSSAMIYVAEGLAHGYLTLFSQTKVIYFCSKKYHQEAEMGVRLDDPFFSIQLYNPQNNKNVFFSDMLVSEKDRSWPFFQPLTL